MKNKKKQIDEKEETQQVVSQESATQTLFDSLKEDQQKVIKEYDDTIEYARLATIHTLEKIKECMEEIKTAKTQVKKTYHKKKFVKYRNDLIGIQAQDEKLKKLRKTLIDGFSAHNKSEEDVSKQSEEITQQQEDI